MRTAAIETVVENYEPLTQDMEEINRNSHDEYGAMQEEILVQLHTFGTYFGFKLSHLVFSATEQLSCFLQTKDVSLQEAPAVAVRFFDRIKHFVILMNKLWRSQRTLLHHQRFLLLDVPLDYMTVILTRTVMKHLMTIVF